MGQVYRWVKPDDGFDFIWTEVCGCGESKVTPSAEAAQEDVRKIVFVRLGGKVVEDVFGVLGRARKGVFW